MTTQAPERPILRYPGGKWRLAPWIISHFPDHKIYVEPFGGGASVLLRKPRSQYGEVYNDLDGEVVNLFRVLRDFPDELERVVHLTPFSREECALAMEGSTDSVERARLLLVRSHMAQGSCVTDVGTGLRSKRAGSALPAADWANFPQHLHAIVERMRGVVIENRNALDVMLNYDGHEALFYLDPPYVHSSRANRHARGYRFEMTDDEHIALSNAVKQLEGKVIISGYPSELYDELYQDWERVERVARTDRGADNVECLWL